MAEVEVIVEAENTLGEGPMWNVRDQALYWTDAKGKPRIQRWEPKSGEVIEWAMPDLIGSFVFREKGGLIAGLKSGFYELDLDKGTAELFHDPEPDKPTNRLNDGKCDRRGRYWCGSLDDSGEASAARAKESTRNTCDPMWAWMPRNRMAVEALARWMAFSAKPLDTVKPNFESSRPVVMYSCVCASTPGVMPTSGCPGVIECSLRNCAI